MEILKKRVFFKILSCLLMVLVFFSIIFPFKIYANPLIHPEVYFEDFEDSTYVPSEWYAAYGGSISITNERSYFGNHSLKMENRGERWHSPAINIYDLIRQNGAATYIITMYVFVTETNNEDEGNYLRTIIRGTEANSFIQLHETNYFAQVSPFEIVEENVWYRLEGSITVTEDYIASKTGQFNLMIDSIRPSVGQKIYIDGITVMRYPSPSNPLRYKLLAYDDGEVNRAEYFEPTESIIIENVGNDVYTDNYTEMSKDDMKRLLWNNDIFIIHTHGYKQGFYLGGDTYLTMTDIDGYELSNLDFALLLTCETGKDFDESHITADTPVNIVEKMVCQGAESVVGFKEITYVSDCNKLAEDLMEQTLTEGWALALAFYHITYNNYIKDMKDIKVIGGNQYLRLDANW